MSATRPRPAFDPELATFLAAFQKHGRLSLTTTMLPRMRQLDTTLEELDERLRSRGLERRTVTAPGHRPPAPGHRPPATGASRPTWP